MAKVKFLLSVLCLWLMCGASALAVQYGQCTEYAADEYGISHYGSAKTWYDDPRFLNSGYTQHATPAVGAIIVFDSWDFVDGAGKRHWNPSGHVGIVRQVLSSSEIKIDHANWHNDEVLLMGVAVKQVSGSWSVANVKYNPSDTNYGPTAYPVRGFLYPPSSSYSVIGMNSPYFKPLCIDQNPWDVRCVTADIDPWLVCRDTSGGPSPLCEYGIGGGDYTTSLPDIITNKAWLQDASGKPKTKFLPKEAIFMKGQLKNVGRGNPSNAITVKFYLSNGKNPDTNKQTVGTDTVQATNLTSGSTHTETESIAAPIVPGTYNVQVCADTGNTVSEEVENNNCLVVVFQVDDLAWLIPIL